VADSADPAKKENPRFEALIGGSNSAAQYFLAARYFHRTPDEWDAMPWYHTVNYIDGLHEQGIIGGRESRNATPPMGGQPGKPTLVSVDYADAIPLPRGFKTRRAG
jgi:hypothetical protein